MFFVEKIFGVSGDAKCNMELAMTLAIAPPDETFLARVVPTPYRGCVGKVWFRLVVVDFQKCVVVGVE